MLNKKQLESYRENGFLLVKGVLNTEKDIAPIIEEYKAVLNELAEKLVKENIISSLYKDLSFSDRYIKIMLESGQIFADYFDFTLPQGNITEETHICLGEAIYNTLVHPKVLDVAESIIGSEIFVSPVQHVRIKPPEFITPKDQDSGRVLMGATPWHQDAGVVLPDADQTNALTVWSPLQDVGIENGCLYVVPGSHIEGLRQHCPGYVGGASAFVPSKLFEEEKAIAIPMEVGDILLLHRNLVHASLSNKSEEIRWSFDLRYCPVGEPTGRDMYPGFVARSKSKPESVLKNYHAWVELWENAKKALALKPYTGKFHRWGDSEVCA